MNEQLAIATLVDVDRLLSFAKLNDYFECDCGLDEHAEDCMVLQEPQFNAEMLALQAYLQQRFKFTCTPLSID